MKELIKDNYLSTVERGLINISTTKQEFLHKLYEEVCEFRDAEDWDNVCEEAADVILVVLNFAKHFDIDIETELKNKIEKNWRRCEKT
jgi:NTP pyrophosphatase (non-canonical NTP hydrolase)